MSSLTWTIIRMKKHHEYFISYLTDLPRLIPDRIALKCLTVKQLHIACIAVSTHIHPWIGPRTTVLFQECQIADLIVNLCNIIDSKHIVRCQVNTLLQNVTNNYK